MKQVRKKLGSEWTLLYSKWWRKAVLHTDGVSYVKRTGSKHIECWAWDANGDAVSRRWITRNEAKRVVTEFLKRERVKTK
jgi:hypothetical protein